MLGQCSWGKEASFHTDSRFDYTCPYDFRQISFSEQNISNCKGRREPQRCHTCFQHCARLKGQTMYRRTAWLCCPPYGLRDKSEQPVAHTPPTWRAERLPGVSQRWFFFFFFQRTDSLQSKPRGQKLKSFRNVSTLSVQSTPSTLKGGYPVLLKPANLEPWRATISSQNADDSPGR